MWWRCVKRARNGREFLFYALVLAIIFAAAPLRAQDTTSGQAKTLKEELDKLKSSGVEPKNELNPAELTLLARSISRFLEPASAVRTWGNELRVLLADPKLSGSDQGLTGALTALEDAISKFLDAPAAAAAVSAADVNAQLKALKEALTRLRPAEGEPKEKIDPAVLTQLATAIGRVLDPTLASTAWATDLTFVLEERNPKSDEGLKNDLVSLQARVREQLKNAKPGPLQLNIVQAWYGDFHYIRKAAAGQLRINAETGTGFRVCDATNEVRSACQAKTSCPFSLEEGSPAAKLCGEHPAPDASGDVVGVGVEFQCLPPQADWNELQNIWRLADGAPSKMVMLRAGTSVAIRCAANPGEFGAEKGNSGGAAPQPGQKQ